MEIGLAILLFVCMTALLYVLLSLKITRQVDLQMKEFYKTRIHSDIQEFYREMEGYAVLMENRIQRFKSLVERSEAPVDRSAALPATEPPSIPPVEASPREAQHLNRKPATPKVETRAPVADKKKAAARADKKTAKPLPTRQLNDKKSRRQPIEPVKAAAPVTPRAKVQNVKPAPVAAAVSHDFSRQFVSAEAAANTDADTTIAEELMKDLFAQDEMQLSRRVNPAAASETKPSASSKPVKPTVSVEAEASGVTGIFARIGKALEPVVFGERPRETSAAPQPAQQPATASEDTASKKNTDFAEVLRRAEQIKAEKKAERERAEIEARAEFYTAGDAFVPSARAGSAAQAEPPATSRRSLDTAWQAAPRAPEAPAREAPARNSLAVKSLDDHTISFLIDSLKHDAGYRKQALRALTENNIPLEEIARLSRIDIGELQLMSQLGKF